MAARMAASDITPAPVSRDVLIKTFHPSNIGAIPDVHNMCRKLGPHVTTCGNRARENFINSNDAPPRGEGELDGRDGRGLASVAYYVRNVPRNRRNAT